MDLIYGQFVRGKGIGYSGGWGYLYLASCEHHFIRVHENLVQYPSNDISIGIQIGRVVGEKKWVLILSE